VLFGEPVNEAPTDTKIGGHAVDVPQLRKRRRFPTRNLPWWDRGFAGGRYGPPTPSVRHPRKSGTKVERTAVGRVPVPPKPLPPGNFGVGGRAWALRDSNPRPDGVRRRSTRRLRLGASLTDAFTRMLGVTSGQPDLTLEVKYQLHSASGPTHPQSGRVRRQISR
jgi:hypothetical protein